MSQELVDSIDDLLRLLAELEPNRRYIFADPENRQKFDALDTRIYILASKAGFEMPDKPDSEKYVGIGKVRLPCKNRESSTLDPAACKFAVVVLLDRWQADMRVLRALAASQLEKDAPSKAIPARNTPEENTPQSRDSITESIGRESAKAVEKKKIDAEGLDAAKRLGLARSKIQKLTDVQKRNFIWLSQKESGMTGGQIRDAWNKRYPKNAIDRGKNGSALVRTSANSIRSLLKKLGLDKKS